MQEHTDQRGFAGARVRRGRNAPPPRTHLLRTGLIQRFASRRDEEVDDAYRAWQDRTRDLLRFFFITHELHEAQLRELYRRMCLRHARHMDEPRRDVETDLRDLETVARKIGRESGAQPVSKVLVVHGRNHEVREEVARLLMKLGVEPILLDEQAAMGRTLIEKLEAQTDMSFAIVILTGDDLGSFPRESGAPRPRARQNVIFELGFSVGQLGRDRVCALYEEGVELPSDIHGVEYTVIDGAGAWRAKLARELHEAGFRFDPLKILA